jgi:hypothetical protein
LPSIIFFFIVLLFICACKAWVISPPAKYYFKISTILKGKERNKMLMNLKQTNKQTQGSSRICPVCGTPPDVARVQRCPLLES